MDRRSFIKAAAITPVIGAMGACASTGGASCVPTWCGKGHPLAGKPLPPWKPGEFQVHFIYTGVGESMFIIFPDSTTMLFDCGDHAAVTRLDLAVPVLPGPGITVLGLYHVGSRERALK